MMIFNVCIEVINVLRQCRILFSLMNKPKPVFFDDSSMLVMCSRLSWIYLCLVNLQNLWIYRAWCRLRTFLPTPLLHKSVLSSLKLLGFILTILPVLVGAFHLATITWLVYFVFFFQKVHRVFDGIWRKPRLILCTPKRRVVLKKGQIPLPTKATHPVSITNFWKQ